MPQPSQFQAQTLALFDQMENQPPKRKNSLREQIILLNMGLAHTLAQSYSNRCSVPLEDLRQLASLGLCLAVDTYNPSKGSFSSYAAQRMRSEMMHYNRDKTNIVKGPRQERDRIKLIDDIWRTCHINGVPSLSKIEIAYIEFGWDASEYQRAVGSTKRSNVSSLDCGESPIEIPTTESPEEFTMQHEEFERQLAAIAALLSRLPNLSRRFVQHFYLDKMTYAEIAKIYGKSRQFVQRQIEGSLSEMRGAL